MLYELFAALRELLRPVSLRREETATTTGRTLVEKRISREGAEAQRSVRETMSANCANTIGYRARQILAITHLLFESYFIIPVG